MPRGWIIAITVYMVVCAAALLVSVFRSTAHPQAHVAAK